MVAVTFLHGADLHLDSPFAGMGERVPPFLFEKMKESTFVAFTKLIDCAIRERVHFVLLAGDLYDRETRSLRAQLFLREQFQRLYASQIDVYVIYGNHDYIGGDFAQITMPDNVHVFTEPYVERKEYVRDGRVHAHIYGFSYHQRAVIANMTNQYEKEGDAPFHIGLLHGSADGDGEHSRYAPFSVKELVAKGFDYWALGHIHTRHALCEQPPIVYAGNTQGRHRKETGEKGCYLVTLEQGTASRQFISTSAVVWENAVISIEGMEHVEQLLSYCETMIETYRRPQQGICLYLTFSGYGELSYYLQDYIEEFIEQLQAKEEREDFVYVVQYENHTLPMTVFDTVKENNPFFATLLEEVEQSNYVADVVRPMIQAARDVPMFSQEEQQDIMEAAKRIVMQGLVRREDEE